MVQCVRPPMLLLLLLPASVGAVAGLDRVVKLTASDAAAGDLFGWAVSLSGDTALVGASKNDDGSEDSGSAYIFNRDQGGPNAWGLVAKLTASDAAARDAFGKAVSLSGDMALVGAEWDVDGGVFSGSAYIFNRDQGGPNAWGQVAKLTASDAAAGDWFGYAVSLSDDTALVGAKYADDGGVRSGSAYIFQRDRGGPNAWGQVAKLTASDAAADDGFGVAVSLSGDTALVGAYRDDDGSQRSGSAYVFRRNQGGPNAWGQVAKLTASDAAAEDAFGWAVSLSDDTALVGAKYGDDGGVRSGSAYIFQRDRGGPNAWGQMAKLTASDAAADDEFGVAVSLSGDTALVGAYRDDDGSQRSGSAYVFRRDEGGRNAWGQVAKLTTSDAAASDAFGLAVALSGDMALVGAPGHDAGGAESGSAYILPAMQMATPTATPTTTLTVSPTMSPTKATYAPTSSPLTSSPTSSPIEEDKTRSPSTSPTVNSKAAVATTAPTASEMTAGLGVGAIVGISAMVGLAAGALAAVAAAIFFVRRQTKPTDQVEHYAEAIKVASVMDDGPAYAQMYR